MNPPLQPRRRQLEVKLFCWQKTMAVLQPTQEFFTMNGYNVPEAKNGEDALTVTRNNPHPMHLMITDVVMPQIGGARLAEQMAVERPETKVLFVSGYAENTLQRQGVFDI